MELAQVRHEARPHFATEVITAAEITRAIEAEMYALFSRAYDQTDPLRFRSDLRAKRDVLLLRDGDGRIAGFTTLAILDAEDRGRGVRIVFSGDTIIDPACWGTNALNFAWIRHIARIRRERPDHPLYWLLISKGYRTYRYLSTFAERYVPHPEDAPDTDLIDLRDRLARQVFGTAYDPIRGIVAWAPPRDRLNRALADLPLSGRAAEEAARFAALNPGWRQGEELVCLCPLETGNMKPFARRLYGRALEC